MTSGDPSASVPARAAARGRPIRTGRRAAAQGGFGYLMVLFALAAMGLLLAGAGQVWHTVAVREREAQLLFIGQQFRQALASYRDRSPVGSPNTPASLDDLLADKRFPVPVPHLRRLWRDPMTNQTDWALVLAEGRIVGVHSRSDREPLRSAFERRDAAFAGLESYAQWVFVAAEPRPAPPLSGTASVTTETTQ